MAKYTKEQWITAEETYKNTGSYIQARDKSRVPINNIKVKSLRKNWKPEKDENVHRIHAEIASTIRQETKEEIKTVLEKNRSLQAKLEPLLNNKKPLEKIAVARALIECHKVEGKITGELVKRTKAEVSIVEMKPLLGGASVRQIKELRKIKDH